MVSLYLDFSSTCILIFFIILSKSIRNCGKTTLAVRKSHFRQK
eukprot:UN22283